MVNDISIVTANKLASRRMSALWSFPKPPALCEFSSKQLARKFGNIDVNMNLFHKQDLEY